ncbi:NUDIX hydrolase [Aestuariicella hydrocarbonica]|uniref:NUDIX hydrolase n=1 Tax=Pseudomaricurvus hydrocarbonicus TaxID=1470433 RepID=A0A9E5JTQ9_9GAMM|nr:NUDIX hydrolase [Aestuariicella hydrocarbonica]NHO65413.1 NUDIX hydrolase [Aestuariicella hydrocarbonica]
MPEPLNAPSSDSAASVPADPAATIILLRPARQQFEVLLLLRAQALKFAGGSWVFPGGRIEPDDAPGMLLESWDAARIGAARECQEEAGLTLDPDSFLPYSQWTTPELERRRFSTWFLIGCLDEDAEVIVDDGEIVDYQWLTPSAALQKHRQQQLSIMPPAYLTLLELSRLDSIEQARAFAQSREPIFYLPKMIKNDKEVSILYADDVAYHNGDLQQPGIRNRVTKGAQGWEYTHCPASSG